MKSRLLALRAEVLTDLPWTAARTRPALFCTLLFLGILGGALQGKILYLSFERDIGGDVYVWSLIEYFAWTGGALGLAVGMALTMSRNLPIRLFLGALLGIATVTGSVFAYSGGEPISLFGSAVDASGAAMIEQPWGWGLYLGAPAALALTLICHLARRALLKPWMLLPVLLIGAGLVDRVHTLVWDEGGRALGSRALCGMSLQRFFPLEIPHLIGFMVFAFLLGYASVFAELIGPLLVRCPTCQMRWLILASANLVLIVALAWGFETLPFAAPSSVESLAFTPDGEFLVSAHEGGSLRLWRVRRDERSSSLVEVDRVRVHRGPLRQLKFAVSSKMVAVWSDGGKLSLWQVGPFRRLLELPTDMDHRDPIVFSPDGMTLLMRGQEERLQMWDLHHRSDGSFEVTRRHLQTGPTYSLAALENSWTTPRFSENSEWLIRPLSGFIEYLDRSTGRAREYLPLQKPIVHSNIHNSRIAAYSPDGYAIAATGDQGALLVIHIPSGEVAEIPRHPEERIVALAISPDGRELTAASAHCLKRWEISGLRCLQDWTSVSDDSLIRCIEYSPVDGILIVGLESGAILLQETPGDALARRTP